MGAPKVGGAFHEAIDLDGVDDGQGFADLELFGWVEREREIGFSNSQSAVLDRDHGKLEVAAGDAGDVDDCGEIEGFLELNLIAWGKRCGHRSQLLGGRWADDFDEHLRVVDRLGEYDESLGDEI